MAEYRKRAKKAVLSRWTNWTCGDRAGQLTEQGKWRTRTNENEDYGEEREDHVLW